MFCEGCGTEVNGATCRKCGLKQPEITAAAAQRRWLFKKKADDVAVLEGALAVVANESSKDKLSITVHSVSGVHVRPGLPGASQQFYWSLRLLSADGKRSQTASSSSVAYDTTLPVISWEETFHFTLEFEGQVLELKLKERDAVLGYTTTRRDHGTLYWQIYSEKLRKNSFVNRTFSLRHPLDVTRVVDGVALLSASCANSRSDEEGFWRMFERQDADLQKRAVVDGFDEDKSQIAVVLQHIRPILEAYWVLLYTILRPVYWTVVEVRTLLTDWEDPGATILAFGAGLWMYWSENVLFGLLVIVLYKLVRLAGSKPIDEKTAKKMDARAMLLAYGESRKALFYGREDPISYKLLSVEAKLQKLGQSLHRLETAFLTGDRRTCQKIIGFLIVLALSVKFLPLASMITFGLRQLFLFVLLHVSIFVPIRRRLPLLFPGMSRSLRSFWKGIVSRVLLPIRAFFFKRFGRIDVANRGDGVSGLSEGANIRNEEWMMMCKEIGKKMLFGPGERVGAAGETNHVFYRLVAGEVLIRSETSVDVTAVSPATLLAANVLIGHGRQTQEIVARRPCVMYEVRVDAFRFFLVSHPNFAKSFWASMASKVARELKYWMLTATGAGQSFGANELDEDGCTKAGGMSDPFAVEAMDAEEKLKKKDLWNLGNADQREAILRQMAKDAGVTGVAPSEMDVFSGVLARLGGLKNDRFTEGIFVFAKSTCMFHALDRRHAELDYWFDLNDVEGTKWTPPRRFRQMVRLKITVGSGGGGGGGNIGGGDGDAMSMGGAAAAMRMMAADPITGSRQRHKVQHFHLFGTDPVQLKRLMRAMSGRIMLLNMGRRTTVDSNLYGPSLLGVELTAGIETMERAKLSGVQVNLDRFSDVEDVTGGTRDATLDHQAPEQRFECVGDIFKRRSQLFSDQDKIALERLSYKLDRMYKAGAVILTEGLFYNCVFMVLEGVVAIVMSGVEVATMEGVQGKVTLVGAQAFVMGEAMPHSLIAKTAVTIRVVNRANMDTLMEKEPSFGSRFYEMIVYELIDKVARIWMAYLSRDEWEAGMELISKKVDEEGPKIVPTVSEASSFAPVASSSSSSAASSSCTYCSHSQLVRSSSSCSAVPVGKRRVGRTQKTDGRLLLHVELNH